MKSIFIFVLFKLIFSSETANSVPPLSKDGIEGFEHKSGLYHNFYNFNDGESYLSDTDSIEDYRTILSRSSSIHTKVDSTLNKGSERVNGLDGHLTSEKTTLYDKKTAQEVPLDYNISDLAPKRVVKPVLVPVDKLPPIDSKKIEKEDKKLSDLIDRELLSKTNLKGNTLSHNLSRHLIKKLTENLDYFAKNPSSLVNRLEKLTNEKLPSEYKSKLLFELGNYRSELKGLESETNSDPFKTEEETLPSESKHDLNSKFAQIIVPILIPLLKPLLESIIIRITSKDFYEDIKDFFQNLFKIKSDPGWTFWKGFKRIFFGKTEEELEDNRKTELDELFTSLKQKLDGELLKEAPGESEEYKREAHKSKHLEIKKSELGEPNNREEGSDTKDSEKEKEKFQPPPIKESTNELLKKRKKLTDKEKEYLDSLKEGIDLDSISPLPEPFTPEERQAVEKAQKLFNEGRVKEYKELMSKLNDYYQKKINKRAENKKNNSGKSEEESYYPEIFKHMKKEVSGFKSSSLLLVFLLVVFNTL